LFVVLELLIGKDEVLGLVEGVNVVFVLFGMLLFVGLGVIVVMMVFV